jgi:hypothetical protein
MEKQEENNGKYASPNGSPIEDSTRGIPGRIMASASGLLHDSLSPSGTQQANTLARVLASEGKAGSSTASANSGPGATDNLHGGPIVQQGLAPVHRTSDTFREPALTDGRMTSGSGDVTEEMSLDQFIQRSQDEHDIPTLQQSSSGKGRAVASTPSGSSIEHQAPDAGMSRLWNSISQQAQSQTFSAKNYKELDGTNGTHRSFEITPTDGADVVKLLQDPNASLPIHTPEKDDVPYIISEEDMKIAEEIVRCVDIIVASKPPHKAALSAAIRGEPFPEFSSFFDGIQNYQDEVWGYLLPLVEQAKREVVVSYASNQEEGPATRRLRMILSHIDRKGKQIQI